MRDFILDLYDGVEYSNILIRYLKPNSLAVSRLYAYSGTDNSITEPSLNQLEQEVQKYNSQGWNVYFGVTLRDDKEQPEIATALWVDIDEFSKANSLVNPKQSTILQLVSSENAPSCIVDSGRGLHCYWYIEPTKDFDYVVQANKCLAKQWNGDNCSDITRLLRLPNTFNHKSNAQCKVIANIPMKIYSVYDFNILPMPKLSKYIANIIETGESGNYSSRSHRDFAVIMNMIACDYTDEQIREVFETKPVGDKYQEHPNGDAYLKKSIEKGRELHAIQN